MSRTKSGGATFGRRIAALTTASSLALVAAQPAFAQDADEDLTEESAGGTPEELDQENVIIVTGISASLSSAQDFKERADTVVDVITAEDIGALADRSVAEALQRVPGVNIGRFEKTSDPTRFSVEGTGVIIRGLPDNFGRSELNGRDIFSATGGRSLSFEDVSPELVGRVEVFKNVTADMIEGQISGLVNLVTRKPLDKPGLNIAGSIEANYGDLREKWSPTYNLLVSDTFDSAQGTFGVQLSYSNSKLKSRTDSSQAIDPCYRPADLSGGCQRVFDLNSGGFGDEPNYQPSEFPPSGSVLVPQYAGVRTTDLDRDREAISGVAQFESVDGGLLMTLEYLRSETTFSTEEFALIGRMDDGVSSPEPRSDSTWQFADGKFVSGILTDNVGDAYATPFGLGGIPLDSLRFLRDTKSVTQDISFDIDTIFSDRFRGNFEAQYIKSDLTRDSVFGAMSTWADIDLDLSGETPNVQFIAPLGAPADYFSSGFYTYYWFGLDSREDNDADMFSLRGDFEYDISEDGFFKKARFGARWAARDRTTRNTNFSTWGNLSAPWAGRGGCAPWGEGPGCFTGPQPWTADWSGFTPGRFYTGLPGQEFAIAGGAFTDEFPNYSQLRSPFADGFQRGEVATPIPGGEAWFYGGDDFLQDYLDGVIDGQWDEITTFSQTPERFNLGVNGRQRTLLDGTVVDCDPFCPSEISDVAETTTAAYARVDYGMDFDNGWSIGGNIGLRYADTLVRTDSLVAFPDPAQFDAVANGGNGDGVVQPDEISGSCPVLPPDAPVDPDTGSAFGPQILYCDLEGARLAEYASLFTGEVIRDNRDITFDHWLPSFNIRLDTGTGFVLRGAVSKGIVRPDLNNFSAGGVFGFSGRVDSGPLLSITTGNRGVRPVESWNYDISAEWYFAEVGSLTAAFFLKDITGLIDQGTGLQTYTADSGTTADVIVRGPANDYDGTLKGFELAYQHKFDFLPGPLDGFGVQASYTYIDANDFTNPTLSDIGNPSVADGASPQNVGPFQAQLPLRGFSEHTINGVVFYEKGPFSARAAYNWRSEFLVTPRDDLFPFSPTFQEAGGQLDASIFYTVNENLKLGVQGVNLLDEVTKLSTVVDYDGTRFISNAFRNDRRYTFLARFNF
ncbi:TonB-dependent receptor [Qipengyuania sp. GH38]|uniref:TonB-dependent receptor n=1 Tax=Qipengyuania intermedia TaxID=2867244 RepID=UPI001C884326|nr:TonB-dependent receptor [Qipengyuania intermedia]MBX7514544.1 TonB-dependent receptor [Qipengyuania intermedia]